VLEAVGLAVSNNKSTLISDILESRQFQFNEVDLELFFYFLDASEPIVLTSTLNGKVNATVRKYMKMTDEASYRKKRSPHLFEDDPEPVLSKEVQLLLMSDNEGEDTFKDVLIFSSDRRRFYRPKPKDHPANCLFVTNFSAPPLYDLVSQSLENNLEQELIKPLQAVDSRIKDIVPAYKDVLVNIGVRRRLTINVMGDGIKRIATITACLINSNDQGILLVDEIDTGLHYTSLTHLWKAVLATLKERPDLQLFATTHSDECVRALYEVLKEEHSDDLENAPATLIRLERGEDQHYATNYTPDVMYHTLLRHYEYR